LRWNQDIIQNGDVGVMIAVASCAVVNATKEVRMNYKKESYVKKKRDWIYLIMGVFCLILSTIGVVAIYLGYATEIIRPPSPGEYFTVIVEGILITLLGYYCFHCFIKDHRTETITYEQRCENCIRFEESYVMNPTTKKYRKVKRCREFKDRYGRKEPAWDDGNTRGIWHHLKNSKPCSAFKVNKKKVEK